MKKVTVKYYALLREKTGKNQDFLETTAENAIELYNEIKNRYNINLDYSNFRVAINEEMDDSDCEIKDGDTIVFIQPVAGG